jgi:hypothetical protein
VNIVRRGRDLPIHERHRLLEPVEILESRRRDLQREVAIRIDREDTL